MINPMLLTDGYKLGHKSETPKGTTKTYSNLTPRGSRMDTDYAMFFGMQYVCKELLIKKFNDGFFNRPKEEVMTECQTVVDSYLGPGMDISHFGELHDLGYLPIKIKALPEGSKVPLRVPVMTIENTHDDFFWLTNYLETIISSMIWMPCTSLTTAFKYRQTFDKFAKETGNEDFVDFQGHDFSFRGMSSPESAIVSGMAFLTCFKGTDCIPALPALCEYYNADLKDLIGCSVPATEHALACLYTAINDEYSYFEELITKIHPAGIVSLVSDTYDYWGVLTEFLPRLKDQIMARDGKVVIRPDSGNPVEIICGKDIVKIEDDDLSEIIMNVLDDGELFSFRGGTYCFNRDHYNDAVHDHGHESVYDIYYADFKDNDIENLIDGGLVSNVDLPEHEIKGSIEVLWDLFGGTVNEKGYKELDPHVGLIYGEAITPERQVEIFKRLKAKGFASTNVVLGLGSYGFQYKTRDSLGWAIKGVYAENNGNGYALFKDPKTDDGTKKSAKGLVRVNGTNGNYTLEDGVTWEREGGALEEVFVDGKLTKECTLEQIRARVKESL
jgi:nicotinamide phosphoribosyltransferase